MDIPPLPRPQIPPADFGFTRKEKTGLKALVGGFLLLWIGGFAVAGLILFLVIRILWRLAFGS